MGYAFFTDLPASTKLPADLVGGGKAAAAIVARGRLIGSPVSARQLPMAASFFAAIVHCGLILLCAAPAKHLISEGVVAMPIDATRSAASSANRPSHQ